MKIINQTDWRTDHLRAILRRAAEQELEPAKRKEIVVTVVYGRRCFSSSGLATYGGRRAIVRVPSPELPARKAQRFLKFIQRAIAKGSADAAAAGARHAAHWARYAIEGHVDVLAVASVACHEFAHLRGMRHRQMPAHYGWRGNWRGYVAWADGMPLERKPVKQTKRPTIDDRLMHIQRMRRLAETRLRRAQTILKKWRRREKDTERRLAAQQVR